MGEYSVTWLDKALVAKKSATVGVHFLIEKALPRKATKASDVPRSFEAITPEWLTAVLCKGIPNAKILDVQPTGGSVGTSTRQGIALTLNAEAAEAGIPTRLFTKCMEKYTQRLLGGFAGILSGELDFYMKIRPPLKIEAPLGYHACVDDASWRNMILMEDVADTKGARFISTETYVTRPMMEDFLGNMATWHGYYWNHPRFGGDLAHLRTPLKFLHNIDRLLSVRERSGKGVTLAAAVIPPTVQGRTDALYDALVQSFEINARGPHTLLHGDLHIGQTYLTREGRIGVADWPVIQRGGWAYDYAYAVASSLTVEDRRLWDRELLRFYLDRLHASGGPRLDFDAAYHSYRQHMPYPYLCWLMTLVGQSSVTPDMQREYVSMNIVERSAHAIEDLETLKAFP